MWTRKELKENGKALFKRNYWKCVLISLIMVLIAGGYSGGSSAGNSSSQISEKINEAVTGGTTGSVSNESVESFVDAMGDASDEISELMNDASDVISNPATIVVIILVVLFIFLIALAIGFAFSAFLINPLHEGCIKFYVANHSEPAALSHLGFGFSANYMNMVKTLFLRDIFLTLWSFLLIIPGIVKAYEYRMIPYLLSENPDMDYKEAFAKSKEMMTGQKWNAFVLDLSFLGWHILSIFTLGILSIFYVNPYVDSTNAELYFALKNGGTVSYVEEQPAQDADFTNNYVQY